MPRTAPFPAATTQARRGNRVTPDLVERTMASIHVRVRLAAAVLVGSFVLTACAGPAPDGSAGDDRTQPSGPTGQDPAEEQLDAPPPVTVRFFDDAIDLTAYSYCFGNVCADGIPPEEPTNVGSPHEVIVAFPLPGWSFTAFFTPSGSECGRQLDMPLEDIGQGRFLLRPVGYADTYDVTLFGQGGGDLVVTFRWTTPTDGPLPIPEARLAILADHDGRVDSYGVELELSNLAQTPTNASATITVREESGESITFEATRGEQKCLPEGTVYLDGPDDKGLAAAALGEGPFRYEVDLVLDGAHHVAIARWPKDVIKGNEPSVALHFGPDLPALS